MRLGNILVGLTLFFASCSSTQPLSGQIGSVKTEEYTAGFEKKKSLIKIFLKRLSSTQFTQF